jgi:hypothetical protein
MGYVTVHLANNMYVFELLLLLGLPLVLACGASCLSWRALSRPALFLVVATVVLYLLYAVLMWLLNPGPFGYTLSIHQPGETPAPEPFFLLLPSYKIPLVAFAIAAVPTLAVLLRVFKKGARP